MGSLMATESQKTYDPEHKRLLRGQELIDIFPQTASSKVL